MGILKFGIQYSDTDTISYDRTRTHAMPIGGFDTLYKHFGNVMKYPAEARRYGIEGRVFIQFIVEEDGTLTNVKMIPGIGAGCDEEA